MTSTVFITGASTGIGKATAEYFFERGWNVVATMRTPKSDRTDPRWLLARLDVTEPSSISAALKAATEKFGRIDVLVNNAGYALSGTFESMNDERIMRQFETNVFGLMRVSRAALAHFRPLKSGVLINVASMGGRLTFPFFSVYHATKWAVDGFSESLAFEAEAIGVKVKIIEPGAIKTDFYDRSSDFTHDRALTEYNGIVDKAVPKFNATGAKGAAPKVVAEAIYRAATDGSSRLRYVVGADAKTLLAVRSMIPHSAYHSIVKGQVFK